MSDDHPQICQEMCSNRCKFPYTFPYATLNYVACFGIVKHHAEINGGSEDVMLPYPG